MTRIYFSDTAWIDTDNLKEVQWPFSRVNMADIARRKKRREAAAAHREVLKEREAVREAFRAQHPDRYPKVKEMHDKGMTYADIGVVIGLSRGRVKQIVDKGDRVYATQQRNRAMRWEVHLRLPKGRVDCSIDNERGKWHIWVPETSHREMKL